MQVGIWQILLIVLLFVLLFGSKRIPAMMKDIVKGLKAVREEIDDTDNSEAKPVKPKKKAVAKKKITATTKKKQAVRKTSGKKKKAS